MNHDASILFEESNEGSSYSTHQYLVRVDGAKGGGGLTIVSCGLEHLDALFDRRSCISLVVWWINRWQQSDVDTKVLISQLASLSDRLAEGIWVWLGEGSENPETSRVRNCCY